MVLDAEMSEEQFNLGSYGGAFFFFSIYLFLTG